MPRTQRAIRRRSRRGVAARTTSNDLYRLSGSLGYSNNNGGSNSSSSNGNDEAPVEKIVRRASLSPPDPAPKLEVPKEDADVSEESSDGWSDDENEMSGDVFFSPPDQSSSDSQYTASSSTHSNSNSGLSRGSDNFVDDNEGSSNHDEGGQPDYDYGETFEPKFGRSDFDATPHDSNDGFGAGFGENDMFDMGDSNDYNSPAGYNSSGEGDQFFPEIEMDDQGDFDSGFPEEGDGNGYTDSSSNDDGDHDNGFGSIPMVISSTSDDEQPQDNGLEDDEFADPTRHYDARYDGALSDVVQSDHDEGTGSDNENDFDNDDASNAMYGSGSGLGYITHADNSSRSQPDPLLKPFTGERPPTPPSPCGSSSETSLKSARSAKSARSTRSAKSARSTRSPKSLRSPKSVKLSSRVEADEDQFDCQTYLAPPSINLGSDPDFQAHGLGENDLSVPYVEEESRQYDSELQQQMYDDQFDPYHGQGDQYTPQHGAVQTGDPQQFSGAENEQYHGGEQYQRDEQYFEGDQHHGDGHYHQPSEQHPQGQSYHAEPNVALGNLPPGNDEALNTLEKARARDRKIIRLLAIGLCCALFSFAMVLGGAVTAVLLRGSDSPSEVSIPPNPPPQEEVASPTISFGRAPTLRPSLRPTTTPAVLLTQAPTATPTKRPTQRPSSAPTPAPQSEAPTPVPTVQPTPGTNAATAGFGSGFGSSNAFGSVTVP